MKKIRKGMIELAPSMSWSFLKQGRLRVYIYIYSSIYDKDEKSETPIIKN